MFGRNVLLLKLPLALFAAVLVGGCAGADVDQTTRTPGSLPKPDMVIIQDFAVSPAEVKLDRGLMASAMRDAGKRSPTAEEERVGRVVAEKLSSALVEELRGHGITAVRAGPSVNPSETSAVLSGQFLTVDQGNQSARVWVGFGLGGSELRTRIQVAQGGKLVAEADTSTHSSMKPGMVVSAASGGGAAVAVGAAGAGISEGFLATIEADARRTAKEVAKEIHKAYVRRGWLPK